MNKKTKNNNAKKRSLIMGSLFLLFFECAFAEKLTFFAIYAEIISDTQFPKINKEFERYTFLGLWEGQYNVNRRDTLEKRGHTKKNA